MEREPYGIITYKLTPWGRVLLMELIVTKHFMEPETSLPCSRAHYWMLSWAT